MRLDFLSALRVLAKHGVDFIVVGGVGAVLHGAPVSTFDVDIVHSTDSENAARLLAALTELDAYYRLPADRRLRPGVSHLEGTRHQLLLTRFGPLDVLGFIGNGRRYEDLLPHTEEMLLGADLKVRVLGLETIIASKEETGQEKDLASLPLLRAALAEKKRKET